MKAVKLAIIGGGVIGLSTAQAILEDLDAEVTVYAEEFSPNTTGDVSAGFIFPYLYGENEFGNIKKWTQVTVDHITNLMRSGDEVSKGICPLPLYSVWKEKSVEQQMRCGTIFNGFRELKQEELRQITNQKYAGGFFCSTWTCDCQIYLPYLMRQLRTKGVKFVKTKILSLENLAPEGYDVIVNCTGFGAKDLTGDRHLEPLQGQVFTVKAPWINFAFMEIDGDCYFLPRVDKLVVGGSHEKDASLKIDSKVSRKIWDGACEILPSLRHAEILSENIGLRPGRPEIRMEFETRRTECGREFTVLHHYGHGGSGVTLHWGCAKEASLMLRHHLHAYRKANL